MPVSEQWTPEEQRLINECYELMPERFRQTATPARILQFIEIVVADINVAPPLSYFTASTTPQQLIPVVRFGTAFYSQMFHQMRATLDDFTWSDQGVTVAIDQTAKVSASLANFAKTYEKMVLNFKKTQVIAVGGRGLGTPKYASQLGQFLKIALGSSFSWNTY